MFTDVSEVLAAPIISTINKREPKSVISYGTTNQKTAIFVLRAVRT
jgi:hypothetical protein